VIVVWAYSCPCMQLNHSSQRKEMHQKLNEQTFETKLQALTDIIFDEFKLH
jgi:hypothetical protein